MPTDDATCRPKSESAGKRGYVPGALVVEESRQKRQKQARSSSHDSPSCPWLPCDVLDKILEVMVSNHDGLSVIKLGMVNRSFRSGVNANLDAWFRLYLDWRGPVQSTGVRNFQTQRGIVRLRPTLPISVPNFRVKTPPLTLFLSMDKKPRDGMTDEQKSQALFIYRKVTALLSLRCCGLCGTTRHATRPFWCLGKRLCRSCVQANLVSHLVLYDKYWVSFANPVQTHRSFVDAVCMNVFFFSTRLTPNQRLDFSSDRTDFPGGTRTVWFFWRPHLEQVFNMPALEREGQEKSEAARILRAYTRRAMVLRAMRGKPPAGRKVPTLSSAGVFSSKRHLRTVEFRLRRTELLDKTVELPRNYSKLSSEMLIRLTQAQDRVTPFMYN